MRRLLIPLLMLSAACQDLAVTNPNEPDRTRATRQPASVEAFVASSFRTWWPVAGHDDYPAWALSTIAREVTSGFADFGQLELSAEPRSAWNNSPVNARNDVSEDPWYDLYGAISAVNDALVALDDGLVITDATATARARAFAKFMQGISYGYLGLYFDKAFVIDETTQLDTITTPEFTEYTGVTGCGSRTARCRNPVRRRSQLYVAGGQLGVHHHEPRPVRPARELVRGAIPRLHAAQSHRARGGELGGGDPTCGCRHPDRFRADSAAGHPVG